MRAFLFFLENCVVFGLSILCYSFFTVGLGGQKYPALAEDLAKLVTWLHAHIPAHCPCKVVFSPTAVGDHLLFAVVAVVAYTMAFGIVYWIFRFFKDLAIFFPLNSKRA